MPATPLPVSSAVKTLMLSTDQADMQAAVGLTPGVSAGDIVELDGSAKLPAVDGSQLTNLPGGSSAPQLPSWTYQAGGGTPTAGNFTTDNTAIASTGTITLSVNSGVGGNDAGAVIINTPVRFFVQLSDSTGKTGIFIVVARAVDFSQNHVLTVAEASGLTGNWAAGVYTLSYGFEGTVPFGIGSGLLKSDGDAHVSQAVLNTDYPAPYVDDATVPETQTVVLPTTVYGDGTTILTNPTKFLKMQDPSGNIGWVPFYET